MKLILMTRPEFFVEEHQILTALFDEGLDTLHLRKPNSEPVYSERLLSLIPDGYRKKIVVHDHFYLKQEYGLKGIHLSNRNAEVTQNFKGHISCSCHNAQELSNASSFSDYMFTFSIYTAPNGSEKNYQQESDGFWWHWFRRYFRTQRFWIRWLRDFGRYMESFQYPHELRLQRRGTPFPKTSQSCRLIAILLLSQL